MDTRIAKRLVWTFSLLAFFLCILTARLGYIQVVQGDLYSRRALARETGSVVLEDYSRGAILDRNLSPLTGSFSANRLVVFPKLVDDKRAVASGIASVMGVDALEIKEQLEAGPVRLPYPLTPEQASAIESRNWKGVVVAPVNFRYGSRPLAVQVVGHLGRVRDMAEAEELSERNGRSYGLSDWVGRQGLEKFFEPVLKSDYPISSARLYIDAAGNVLQGLPLEVNTDEADPTRSNVVTTIDGAIQSKVEDIMDRRAVKGAVVVMSRSGDILAMAGRPSYNPDPDKIKDYMHAGKEIFLDQCTALFQPGSIFKVVVAAVALEEGMVSEDTMFFCGGRKDTLISCWHPGHGEISFARAFAESCNPTFARVGLSLGASKIIAYAGRLGLNNQAITGYPVLRDNRQNLNLIAQKYSLVNSSVGQGPVLASPVQITAMMNTIVNEGIYRQPRLVSEISGAGGKKQTFPAGEGKRVLSRETADRLVKLLGMVTSEGVGREAYVPGFGSAGKTGSAQLGDDMTAVNAWFSGFVPLHNPQYIITVLVRDGESGGKTAAPLFREIAKEIMKLP
ncbi:MAG: peptidoglycan glycosyltransferase [Peptococcaceae bacterium BRH_c4b]|nr:MAG: peptidoglycan glycosyltransferase [Peptococcaceae bacterium BRH_c4b]